MKTQAQLDADLEDDEFEAKLAKAREDREARDALYMRVWWRIIVPGIILFALGSWVFSSAMEAAAYNRVTGKNVSTWDAMWIELRVQEGAK